MARRSPDGESRLDYVATIADPTAPTAAELNAGVPLTGFSTGWDFPESGNTIDVADMSSSFNKTAPGTYGGDMGMIDAFRDSVSADDDAWTTLPRGTTGFFVERLFGGDDVDYAAADEVSIYTGTVIARSMGRRERGNPLSFQVSISIEEEPVHNVAVAGA